ncbi:EF-hand domain-containing protein [bacterium]|nr:EF-hand domain-containing protein [bacterium]
MRGHRLNAGGPSSCAEGPRSIACGAEFDANKDGKLSRQEFEQLCTMATAQAREEAAKQAEVARAATTAEVQLADAPAVDAVEAS